MNTFGPATIPFGTNMGIDIWEGTPMEDFLRPTSTGTGFTAKQGLMNIDIVEGANDFTLYCDVPGVMKEDIDMSYDTDYLTIRAKRTPQGTGTKHRAEREFGNLQRKLRLPPDCDKDSAKACFGQGIESVYSF
jgi:HSP20 family molecular chaperone IbpA